MILFVAIDLKQVRVLGLNFPWQEPAISARAGQSDALFNSFEFPERFKKEYSEAAMKCEQTMIEHLQYEKVYKKVAESAAPPYPEKTVLVDGLVEDIYIPNMAGRIMFGHLAGVPYMVVRIKLWDAQSKALIHEMVISTNTDVLFIGLSQGITDLFLPAKMGEIIGEYLHTIIPAGAS